MKLTSLLITLSVITAVSLGFSSTTTVDAAPQPITTNTVTYTGYIRSHGTAYNLIQPKVDENITKVTITAEFTQKRTFFAENMMDDTFCNGGIGKRVYDLEASDWIQYKGSPFDDYEFIGEIRNDSRWNSGWLPNFDGTQDYDGDSGVTENRTDITTTVFELTDSADIAAFMGPATEQFYVRIYPYGAVSGYTYYNLPNMQCAWLTGYSTSPLSKRWVFVTIEIEYTE